MVEILARRGLIQNQDLRIQNQRGGNGNALLLAKAQRGDGPLLKWSQAADLQRFFHTFFRLRLINPPNSKSKRHFIVNHGLTDHLIRILHHETNHPGTLLDRLPLQIFALVQKTSLVFRDKSADYLGQGALAGAVGAHDADHLPFPDVEIDVLQNSSFLRILEA